EVPSTEESMSPGPNGLSFSTLQQPLRGTPIREGRLWYLSAEDQVDAVHFSLYVNGFFFKHEGVEVSISLSPFVLVRNCKFQSGYNATLTDVKIFKISLFAHSACYYFGVRSDDERWAEEERSRWVLDVSRAIRLVTQSLFPPFHITCAPVEGVPRTRRRLMAGYLVHHEDVSVASVVYFELQAHEKGMARMMLYESHRCQGVIGEIPLHESAMCSEKIGINCSCFSVEDHQFSTRTLAERKLWLRAISNVRVKLQNCAPDPTEEELNSFRVAIKEHLLSIRAAIQPPGFKVVNSANGLKCQSMDPLLQRCHPPPRCRGNKAPYGSLPMSVTAIKASGPGGKSADSEVAEESRIELQGIQVELRPMPRATARTRSEEFAVVPKPGDG
ncbi:Hypothetical protein (Fragment), partial [Durusdinium trenchii]